MLDKLKSPENLNGSLFFVGSSLTNRGFQSKKGEVK